MTQNYQVELSTNWSFRKAGNTSHRYISEQGASVRVEIEEAGFFDRVQYTLDHIVHLEITDDHGWFAQDFVQDPSFERRSH